MTDDPYVTHVLIHWTVLLMYFASVTVIVCASYLCCAITYYVYLHEHVCEVTFQTIQSMSLWLSQSVVYHPHVKYFAIFDLISDIY